MPINLEPEHDRAPAGYYLAEFDKLTFHTVTGPDGEPREMSLWQFVGRPIEKPNSTKTYELTIWVTNKFSPKSNQRKLIRRLAGTTTRDEMGTLIAHEVEVDPQDAEFLRLVREDFASWRGERFVLRQQNGTNRHGEPVTYCDVMSVWRAEGEPALLASKMDDPFQS